MTKLQNTDGKGDDPRTQVLLPTPNDDEEENLFVSSIDDGIFTATLLQPSGNDGEEYFSLSEDHDEIFSDPPDALTFSPFDTLIASTEDNTLLYSATGQNSNEEVEFFSPGR